MLSVYEKARMALYNFKLFYSSTPMPVFYKTPFNILLIEYNYQYKQIVSLKHLIIKLGN